MSDLKEIVKYIELLEAEPFIGWTGGNKKGYLTACTSIKKKAEKLLQEQANGVNTGERQLTIPDVRLALSGFWTWYAGLSIEELEWYNGKEVETYLATL